MFGFTYCREMLIWVAVLALALLGLKFGFAYFPAQSPVRKLAVVLLGIVACVGFWLEWRNLLRIDEFQRMLYFKAFTIASFVVLALLAFNLLWEASFGVGPIKPIYFLLVHSLVFFVSLRELRARYR